jgi:4-amino-4-deoxy-L-arabinose transferase-like glycosyltransferase
MKTTVFKYLSLIIFTTIYFYLFTRVLWRVGDEGSIVYGAALVSKGAIPYKEFFEVMGPLTFFWLGFFFKLFGAKLIVARGVLLFTGVSIIFLIYLMTRKYFRGSFDYLPAVLYIVLSIPLWPANNHHWDSNLFVLLSVILFLTWWDKGGLLNLSLSGLTAGIATCFMQNKGLLIIVIFAILLLVETIHKKQKVINLITKLGTLISSYAVVGILVVLFYYINDALSELIYANLIWPLSQYNKVNSVPFGYGLKEWFLPGWVSVLNLILPSTISFLIIGSFLIIFFMVISIPISTLFAFISEKIFSINNRFFNYNTLPLLLCGIALWLSELHRKDITHIIFGSPLLIIIFFLIIFTYLANKKYLKDILLGFISICIILFGTYNGFIALNAKKKIATRKGEIYSFKKDNCSEFLNKNTKVGDWVFVYPYYPMYYFLANVKNPTRYSILMHNINTKAQFNEAINDLEEKKVKYVLWDTIVDGQGLTKWFPDYKHPSRMNLEIEQYLKNNYKILTIENGFRIMKRIS